MERTDYTTIQNVILDAGPIIHLEEIDSLHLLMDFKRLILPDAVWSEVEYHRQSFSNARMLILKKLMLC
ncbi:MAG: hypothetical protein NUV74_17195 [Candidatus Brocadiaceae bacterium]|nr:hypothetical protein [Candidatus Brocadiaceae bacterium]